MEKKENPRELRVYGLPANLSTEVKNIAQNLGVKMSDFMKPHIKKIVESYPESMRIARDKD